MSRIGRMPIEIPAGVEIKQNDNELVVKGPKGTLKQTFHKNMTIKMEGNTIVVTRPNNLKQNRALHGLTRTLIANMITGVTESSKTGNCRCRFQAQKQGKNCYEPGIFTSNRN